MRNTPSTLSPLAWIKSNVWSIRGGRIHSPVLSFCRARWRRWEPKCDTAGIGIGVGGGRGTGAGVGGRWVATGIRGAVFILRGGAVLVKL